MDEFVMDVGLLVVLASIGLLGFDVCYGFNISKDTVEKGLLVALTILAVVLAVLFVLFRLAVFIWSPR